MRKSYFYLGLFLVTSATLMLQLLESRILSVIQWYHLAFFAISMAMFGLTAGAVWLYLHNERYTVRTLSHDLAYFSSAFAITIVLSLVLQFSLTVARALSITAVLVWVLLAVVLTIPYFFAGFVVSLALTRSPFPIGRVYGVDLLGAATGCLGVLFLLNHTDGPSAVIWVAATAAAGAVCFARAGIGGRPEEISLFSSLLQRREAVCLILLVLAVANGLTNHGLQPILVQEQVEKRDSSLLFEGWNTFSRVTAYASPQPAPPEMWGASPKLPKDLLLDQRRLNIDGASASTMFPFSGNIAAAEFLKYDVTNLAYFLPNRHKAAIVGIGGGRDMLAAWVFGLRRIVGIEINPIFIQLLTQDPGFSQYAGLKGLPGTDFVLDEARSWFARTEETFDLIQMTQVNTWAATAAGAFSLGENGVLTLEAWKIFFNRLTPRGVISASRWFTGGEADEIARSLSLAVATLLDAGITEPRRHIFLGVSQSFGTLILARSPFSTGDLQALETAAAKYQYRILISPGHNPDSAVYRQILQAGTRTGLENYLQTLKIDLSPPTDDRPFFFNLLPLGHPSRLWDLAAGKVPSLVIKGNLTAMATLFLIILISLALVLATIVFPLRFSLGNVRLRLAAGGTAYFFLIGVGFMTVEISFLQRLSVFLGHPIFSLSIVLFSLILSAGLGSLASDSWQLNSFLRFTLWALLLGFYLLTLPRWLGQALHLLESAGLLARAGLCIAVVAPAGFLMGFGFPTGMRLVSALDPKPTPWFWGMNGAAGVLAAGLTVACSIAWGISLTIAVGAICYLLLIPASWLIGFGREGEAV